MANIDSEKNQSNGLADDSSENSNSQEFHPEQQKKLDYLLKQAEIMAHFVTNSAKANKRKATTTAQSKKGKKRKRDANTSNSDDVEHDDSMVRTQFDQTPAYINGEMRDYQIRALNWLITLYENGINGILADEMGLGKTLQTISMLGYLKNFEKINGPHLIVVPNSTLRNWLNEINRFCPSLNGLILIGDKDARSEVFRQMKQTDWDVCITSYEMVLLEKYRLGRINWKYVVIDEAHRIKNENTKLSQTLRTFNSKNRLLLTGTPLQNNLHELWALLNYLLPDVFSSSEDFDTWFDSDNCLRGNVNIVTRLHAIMRPFMLRRIKSEVEKSLLPKIELKLFVGLTTLQRETYKKVLMRDIQTINNMGVASQKRISQILMELRKAANHPYLIDGVEPGPPYTTDQHLVDSCGKMMVLDKLLSRLKSQGSRVVLFSQFVIVLNLLEDYLGWRGYNYCRLDGSSGYEERGQSIEGFNAENSDKFIFILSTRAGGLGINLTTADTVIIFDSDWNPQSDFQAIDRVHRIGQKKQVRVFRLITENTVDERIVQRAEIKQRLDQMIIQQGRPLDKESAKQTTGMKRDMIRFGAKHILSSDSADVIDVDIDQILKHGELKTAEEDKKLAELKENGLRNLTMEEASSVSVYQFEGIDFRTMHGSSNDSDGPTLRPRTRKNRTDSVATEENNENMITLLPYKLYPKELYALSEDGEKLDLSYNTDRKEELMERGFAKWTATDFDNFCKAMLRFGRSNLASITSMVPGKTLDEVTKYHSAFMSRGPTIIEDYHDIMKKVKRIDKILQDASRTPSSPGGVSFSVLKTAANSSTGDLGLLKNPKMPGNASVFRAMKTATVTSNQPHSDPIARKMHMHTPAWMQSMVNVNPKENSNSFTIPANASTVGQNTTSMKVSSSITVPPKIVQHKQLASNLATQPNSVYSDLLHEIQHEFVHFSNDGSDAENDNDNANGPPKKRQITAKDMNRNHIK